MKSKIIITLEGGLVQQVLSDIDTECLVVDCDTDDMERSELMNLFPEEDGEELVYVHKAYVMKAPEDVVKLFKRYEKGE